MIGRLIGSIRLLNEMPGRYRRLLFLFTLGALVAVLIYGWTPVNATLYRLGFIGGLLGFWLGSLCLSWPWKPVRYSLLMVALLILLPFVLPGREIDQAELRADYVQRMHHFEGTVYYWGGESTRGIDCSGLPRKALRDALLVYGLKHGNGRACRMFLEQWWFDTSAEALGQGYRGFTVSLNQTGVIKAMSYQSLEPGDVAVTVSGVHTLVYLGGELWIQAAPGIGSVVTLHGRNDSNGWFEQPVTMHRWSVLVK